MESALVGTEIVEQIATREGVDPVDLDVRPSDTIDPDALEALADGTSDQQLQANLRVEFPYNGHVVTVDGSERSIVDEQPPERKRASHRGES